MRIIYVYIYICAHIKLQTPIPTTPAPADGTRTANDTIKIAVALYGTLVRSRWAALPARLCFFQIPRSELLEPQFMWICGSGCRMLPVAREP